MNRILLFITMCIYSFGVYAASPEKEYKKIASKYDVPEEVRTLVDCGNDVYWDVLLNNNETFLQFLSDMTKNKGAEKEAMQKWVNTPKFYPRYSPLVYNDMQGLCDTILMDMGIPQKAQKCTLHIIEDDDVNAYSVLTEDGFAICINSGLLNKPGWNYNMIIGLVAHEYAHGALMHHVRGFYAEAKQRRKNELLGGIAAGLNAVAAGADAYTAGLTGNKPNTDHYVHEIEKIGEQVITETKLYSCKYSREQEYEADLVGFRFMQFMGMEDEYIELLKFLGTDYDFLYSKWSDHPTISNRIAFLLYLKENPEIGNTENAKIRKKKSKESIDW